MRDVGFLFLGAVLAFSAFAADAWACDGLSDGPDGRVVDVPDGNTVVLDSGIVVSLAGIHAPAPAGRRSGSTAEPMAAAAKAALTSLALGKAVRLGLDTEETDRYGRMEAQVYLDDPAATWVEGSLLAGGMAEVAIAGANRHCLSDLIALEQPARAARLGIWNDPYYSVRDAGDPAGFDGLAGHYEIVEGEVVETGKSRDRLYLDFGHVWKTDFTAIVAGKAEKLFAAAGIDPLALKGKRIRIRGWVEDWNGPLIEIGSPAQIEVLGTQ